MTISKKLLIIAGFVGFMVSNVSAYNAVDLKSEIALMKNFAQELKKITGDVESKVAKWLEKSVKSGNYLTDREVIVIAQALDTTVSNHEKVANILNVMLEKKENKLKVTKAHLKYKIKSTWPKMKVCEWACNGAALVYTFWCVKWISNNIAA